MLERKAVYPVKSLCRVLHLSESGYYRWLRNRDKPSSRQLLAVKIKEIIAEHPDNCSYGVNRICLALEQAGIDVSFSDFGCSPTAHFLTFPKSARIREGR